MAGSLLADRGPLALVALVFVLVVPFERCFPRHRRPFRRPELGLDLSHALASPALGAVALVVGAAIGVLSLAWLPGLALRPVVTLLPGWAAAVVGLVLFDAVLYWTHRWFHEVPVLWRFHAIHHSTEHLDWISGFRGHPVDGALAAPAIVFLLAAGFDAETTGVLAVAQVISGLFLHANVRWRLRRLSRFVNTPELHHWHHSNHPEAHDRNYAIFLSVWDQLFGTFHLPADRRPTRYGVSEPIPRGLAAQLWWPFRGAGTPWSWLRHPRTTLRRVRRLVVEIAVGVRRSTLRGASV